MQVIYTSAKADEDFLDALKQRTGADARVEEFEV